MLTPKQRDLLFYIHDYLNEHSVAPSFEEMKEAVGLKSKSGIHRLVNALIERGFLRQLAHKARALEVVKLPDGAGYKTLNSEEQTSKETQNTVVQGNFGHTESVSENTMPVPLYGKIAAGVPIEAIANETETIDIPLGMVSGGGKHFALTVEGDSMIDAGIHEGDIVVIEECLNAPDGTIIVALVDGEEATLKRIKRQGDGTIALIAENEAYEPRILTPDRVQIQGKIKSLLRYY